MAAWRGSACRFHVYSRGVGQLQMKDLCSWYDADARRVRLPREHVEAVETQSEGGMVGVADDPPGVRVRVDVSAPCQRLVGDAQATPSGLVGKLVQLFGGKLVVVDAVG
jgi:hypothetical protein